MRSYRLILIFSWLIFLSFSMLSQNEFWAEDTSGNNIYNTNSGNVGVGISVPSSKLDVNGDIALPSGNVIRSSTDFTSHIMPHEFPSGSMVFRTAGVDRMSILYNSGYVGIGTTNPQSELAVRGTITAQKVVVTLDNWADYVFDEGYHLKPLAEVERHIKERRHLPDIPPAKAVMENGVEVGNMQAKLLQKIEELTLYMIDLKKENESLKKRVAILEGAIGEG